jgi:hypothetical protein
VSLQTIKDILNITFNDSDCFISIQNLAVVPNTSISAWLPRQYSKGIMQLPNYVKNVVTAAAYITVSSFVLNIILQGVLN